MPADDVIEMKMSSQRPLVSIIAVCYNHARFAIECLESIRSQSHTNSELIIVDDCSSDESVSIIRNWISRFSVSCTFIAHTENVGVVRTLNEALSHVNGEYISIIATDDTWEPDKIERQITLMLGSTEQVAVVYSDSAQMDESGVRLPQTFIEAHYKGNTIPSGHIFSALVDGCFLPAMATLIRRQAIEAVGGYDERLTYEDYDMWLRLSARYEFVFCPGIVANYRIVSTSMVRTVFSNPTANHCYGDYLMLEKWWYSDLLSPTQRKLWAKMQWDSAYILYVHGDSRARLCLWKAFFRTRKLRALILSIACTIGISRSSAKNISAKIKGFFPL